MPTSTLEVINSRRFALCSDLRDVLFAIKERGGVEPDDRIPWKACTKSQAKKIKKIGAAARAHGMLRKVLAECAVSYRNFWLIDNGYQPSSGMVPRPWSDGDETEEILSIVIRNGRARVETLSVIRESNMLDLSYLPHVERCLKALNVSDYKFNFDGIEVAGQVLIVGDAKGNAKILRSMV